MASEGPEYAIVGGGITGLSLAIAMLARGLRITIYEQAHKFGEIGAGVAFGPNAVRAMQVCDDSIFRGFQRIATRNGWASKATHWFDYVDGYHAPAGGDGGSEKLLFTIENAVGANSVHRAAYLDELVKLVPENLCRFSKHLDNVSEGADGRLLMTFHDGSTATADAVIGCDGIKSRVRQLILGADNPASHPHYSHKYAYRGLIPKDKAIAALGEDRAVNSFAYLGPRGHVLTFPVKNGEVMNVVAFRDKKEPWPDAHRLTLPSEKSHAIADFKGWGPSVTTIIDLLNDDLDCWGLFDTFDHPATTYAKGRLVITGDAAHASTPHHGAGAGMGIEDAAVLAHILSDARVAHNGAAGIEAAFATFDECRRERSQWLVRTSRFMGDNVEFMAVTEDGRELKDDSKAIEKEALERQSRIWDADLDRMLVEAVEKLGKKLAS